MRYPHGLAMLALTIAAAAPVASATAAAPESGELDFTVMREGEPIGEHRLTFRSDGQGLRIDIKTDVAVKVLFVTAYRFEHDGHELWQDGRLMRLWSKTNDDGTSHELEVKADGDGLSVHGDGARREAPAMVPASLWHEGILRGGTILNTLDGRGMAIDVQDLGAEPVAVRGQQRMAHHYRISGDLDRDLWYDGDNVLVRVGFKGSDGSKIEYVLK